MCRCYAGFGSGFAQAASVGFIQLFLRRTRAARQSNTGKSRAGKGREGHQLMGLACVNHQWPMCF